MVSDYKKRALEQLDNWVEGRSVHNKSAVRTFHAVNRACTNVRRAFVKLFVSGF